MSVFEPKIQNDLKMILEKEKNKKKGKADHPRSALLSAPSQLASA